MTDHASNSADPIIEKFGQVLGPLVVRYIDMYLSPIRPTIRHCYEDMVAEIHQFNPQRLHLGQAQVRVPSRRSFRAALGLRLGNAAGRSQDTSAASLRAAHMQATRRFGGCVAFETNTIEIDVPHIGPLRLVLYSATDTATEYVLGASLSDRLGDYEAIFQTLRMTMQDKSWLARGSGAIGPWVGRCRPESVAIRDGVFAGEAAIEALETLGTRVSQPPLWRGYRSRGEAIVRGFLGSSAHAEFAKTMGERADDVQMEEALSLLRTCLIRFICDGYNNAPHEHLSALSPHSAMMGSSSGDGVSIPPTSDKIRAQLGIEAVREFAADGIHFGGMVYHSSALANLGATHKGVSVTLRYVPEDMRSISVKIDGAWFTADSVYELPADVSIDELMDVHRHLGAAWPAVKHDSVVEEILRRRAGR